MYGHWIYTTLPTRLKVLWKGFATSSSLLRVTTVGFVLRISKNLLSKLSLTPKTVSKGYAWTALVEQTNRTTISRVTWKEMHAVENGARAVELIINNPAGIFPSLPARMKSITFLKAGKGSLMIPKKAGLGREVIMQHDEPMTMCCRSLHFFVFFFYLSKIQVPVACYQLWFPKKLFSGAGGDGPCQT